MNNNIKIELHLIQNFAPSCLNRDDANAPKDCEFGGVRRARISSQCIKRSDRLYFKDAGTVDIGTRTKLLKAELVGELKEKGTPEEVSKAVESFISTYYCSMDKKKTEQTSVLLYIAKPELKAVVACINEIWLELVSGSHKFSKDIAQRLKAAAVSADIAMFGRMLAEDPVLNIDASVQVAHAISTHRVDMDFDFFTAVDDLNSESDTGAGMMGETGFNSACFYRYALIDRAQLIKNLGNDEELADKVIRAFIEASVFAIPTGKQNSFAAQNPPDFGMIVVKRDGYPCSLANAFAKPVQVRQDNLVGLSIESLCELHPRIKDVYGNCGIADESLWHLGYGDYLGELKSCDKGSFTAALDSAMASIAKAAKAVEA